jgi:hypothetical protein
MYLIMKFLRLFIRNPMTEVNKSTARGWPLSYDRRLKSLILRPAGGGATDMTRRVLRDLGYVENKNVTFEYRYADNKLDRLPALADELVRLKVDLILAASANAAMAAKNATRTIPIVFVSMSDPVVAGLVDSLARAWE